MTVIDENSMNPAELVHPSIMEQLSSSSNFDADIVILGSGPGGYYAAIRAAQFGARVVVVEKGPVGGTCLNIGCIPTKVILSCIDVLEKTRKAAEYGIKTSNPEVDYTSIMKRKDSVVNKLVTGVEMLLKKNKVRLIRGFGKISDPHTVVVETGTGVEKVTAKTIIIATGSESAKLPVDGLEIGGNVWTSTEALSFDKAPKSLLVIGAGAIGLEAGYTFSKLGTKVTIVEMMSQILPAADTETSNALQKELIKSGIDFKLNSIVTKAENAKGGKKVYIKSGDNEESSVYENVLVAVGRRPFTQGIGLEENGIKTEKGKVIVDSQMRTNIPSIFAIGDVIGEPMLAHVAWAEAIVAVESALGMESKMDYSAFPACVYTTPEMASVGLTEKQARERFNDVRIGKFGFGHNGKAMGLGENEGFVKIISDGKYGRILGVHMVGPHTTDLITEMVLAMRNELTVDEVIATIHPHPTLSEVVQEAAMDVEKKSIHQ